jgi:hypothetical protein
VKAVCLGLVCLLACAGAAGQALEARRYRNADGIEVLTSRASAPRPGVGASAAVPASSPPAVAPHPIAASAADTALREKDRLAILAGELLAEGRRLEQQRVRLRSPAVQQMTSDEQQALRDELYRHEQNILALNREIRRVSTNGGGSAAGALDAVPLLQQRRDHALAVVALHLDGRRPSRSRRRRTACAAASRRRPARRRRGSSPRTTVVVLPPRPWVSRLTRTVPSPARRGAAPQRQAATGCRQPGHMRPASVE